MKIFNYVISHLVAILFFVRIIRDNDSIVPHGDTQLRYKDRLIVTGTKEYVDELKQIGILLLNTALFIYYQVSIMYVIVSIYLR